MRPEQPTLWDQFEEPPAPARPDPDTTPSSVPEPAIAEPSSSGSAADASTGPTSTGHGSAEPTSTGHASTGRTSTTAGSAAGSYGSTGWAGPGEVADLLAPWRAAGVLRPADVHIASTLARLAGLGRHAGDRRGPAGLDGGERQVVLAVALAARAPRLGHVCLDLATVRASTPAEVEGDADELAAADVEALPWPDDVEGWRRSLAASPLVAEVVDGQQPAATPGRGLPLVLDGTLLYLERYRVYEDALADELRRRAGEAAAGATGEMGGPDGGPGPTVAGSAVAGALRSSAEQVAAAEAGAASLLSVIVGGPGTGKTTTVATLLALLLEAEPTTRVALVAPTGKAAARMGESIAGLAASLADSGVPGAVELAAHLRASEVSTIHRRLGARGDGTFRHHHGEPLVHDVVIVDETSMVSLPLMAHLLDAVRPAARLVLVGDPGQLASVEAGSVLGDIAGPAVDAVLAGAPPPTGPLAGCVHVLSESYRFPAGSAVGRIAAAVRAGDPDAALAVLADARGAGLAAGGEAPTDDGGVLVRWHPDGADTEAGADTVRDAALDGAGRSLAAAERGDAGAALDALGQVRVLCAHRRGPFGVAAWNWRFEQWLAGERSLTGWYAGRPVLVTANDRLNDLANGDLGVVVVTDDGPRVAFAAADRVRLLGPARLDAVETVHAMTIHKSQGSEFDEVVIVLPPPDSRLATRELLYTAVTRARRVVTLVGSEASLRRAVENRVVRQSGLGRRLWPDSAA